MKSRLKCHSVHFQTQVSPSKGIMEKDSEQKAAAGKGSERKTIIPSKEMRKRKKASLIDNSPCYFCYKTFPHFSKLRSHLLLTHLKEKEFPCNICGKEFGAKANLEDHIRRHKGEKAFICNFCGKAFVTKAELELHIRHHIKEKPFKCNLCGKDFCSKGDLDLHIRRHVGEKPYKCQKCGKDFIDKAHLNDHVNRHEGVKKFACNHCSMRFVTKGELIIHTRRHEKPLERNFKCGFPNCLFASATKANARKHRRLVHSDEKPFGCSHPNCEKTYKQKKDLKIHLTTHSEKGKATPFPCTLCGRAFSLRGNLQRHIRSHLGVKEFTCNFCFKSFVAKNDLERHIRRHVKEKWFKCTVCGKDFVEKYELDSHLRRHAGEKPHKCGEPLCKYAAVTLNELKRHQTGVHKKGQGVKQKEHLRDPKENKIPEKGFTCPYKNCGKAFGTNFGLTRHQNTHARRQQGVTVPGQKISKSKSKSIKSTKIKD